jgi:hypothetical protein
MNYGYQQSCLNWDESKKDILAERLCKLLEEFGFKNVNGYSPGSFPYIEVDGNYGGVRIRRITHLSESMQNELVEKVDQIYLEVMQEKNKCMEEIKWNKKMRDLK